MTTAPPPTNLGESARKKGASADADRRVDDLLAFIAAAPTSYHAVREVSERLAAAGFCRLGEGDSWTLASGQAVMMIRDGSLVALRLGTHSPAEAGFVLVGAHTDSPNLRLKPRSAGAFGNACLASVEPYGGLLMHTWLDRDLALAGQIFVAAEDGSVLPESRLVDLRRPLLRIPNLAIHLQRELRQEGFRVNSQHHLRPIWGLGANSQGLSGVLAEELALDPERITACELALYDLSPPQRCGAAGEFIASARLDNLASCHAALCALLASSPQSATQGIVLYDHEEVGSRSAQGAASTWLRQVLKRVVAGIEGSSRSAQSAYLRAASRSLLVSADMAHAIHPNYADRHDADHAPQLGAGPVVKTHAGQSYATEGWGAAVFRTLCRGEGFQAQEFVVRSDLPCGSTIGPISAAQLAMRTVDVGSPMWAMHSCREMAASADVDPMIRVLTALFGMPPCVAG